MRIAKLLLALAVLPRVVAAQCPEGTPPPCRTGAATPRTAAPDPNRIVVLPFRVATSDTLLGEGIAELVAGAFTGEGGPRAVAMGNVIRGWRDAGGAPRVPLQTPVAERLTRQMGAGLYVDGSIVGLGSRLTLSGSVTDLANGSVRRAAPVSGTADSLPVLVERLTAGLLQAAGIQRAGQSARLSDSPDAMRAYIEGLTHFRRSHFGAAAAAFERAFAADPQFGRAAYMRWLTATWGPGFGTPAVALWRGRAQQLSERLSPQDQLVMEASFGSRATKERAAAAFPDSPDIWYVLGDSYYHTARAQGWDNNIGHARFAFERSVALDSQPTSLHHLIEIGLWTRDTALLRAAWPAYDRLAPGNNGLGLLVGYRIGDTRMIESLRRRPARGIRDTANFFELLNYGPVAGVPAAAIDDVYERAAAAVPPNFLPDLRVGYFLSVASGGRPAIALQTVRQGVTRDTTGFRGFNADVWLMVSAALGDGDPAVGEAARERVAAARYADSTDLATARCGTRLWDALVPRTVSFDDDSLMVRHGQPACATLLRVLGAQRAGTLDSATLRQLDSAITARVLWPYSGVGPLLLARAWESLGVRGLALTLLRGGSVGFPDFSVAPRRRAEARLAAQQGDTTGAIRVYREYLDLRRDAEPVLIPQRDSVQAELNRLLGRDRATP